MTNATLTSKDRVSDGDLAGLIKGFRGLLALRDQEDDNILAALVELHERRSHETRASVLDLLILPRPTLMKDERQREVYVFWPSEWDEFVRRFEGIRANTRKASACPGDGCPGCEFCLVPSDVPSENVRTMIILND